MRHLSLFSRVFPPPNFITMPHTGLEISDDALRAIQYRMTGHGMAISRYAKQDLPPGLFEGGDIHDEKQFTQILSKFARSQRMSYVKVALPEEKVYLFQTEIPSTEVRAITQNVEFKLEENVPLSAADAVFYFDILPSSVTAGALRASVSVAPRAYVEKLLSILHSLSLYPMAFEVAPKSIAKAMISEDSSDAVMIVHSMNKKTGIYIVAGGVVCFSSTTSWGPGSLPSVNSNQAGAEETVDISTLLKDIHRVLAYWATRPDTRAMIAKVIFVGKHGPALMESLEMSGVEGLPPLEIGNVWNNAFDVNTYIPPISKNDSLEYAVAAGLAIL